MMTELQARESIVRLGRSLFERGLTPGSSANMSIRIADGYIITPTNSCFGFLETDALSKLSSDGTLISGAPPSKEFVLHQAMYDQRRTDHAIVHLHSSNATLVSCLEELDPDSVVMPLTPYLWMRLGRIALVPYFPPGDTRLAEAVGRIANRHAGIILANHGPIVSGPDPEAVMYSMEELEESAKLMLMARAQSVRLLSDEQIGELRERYGDRNKPCDLS